MINEIVSNRIGLKTIVYLELWKQSNANFISDKYERYRTRWLKWKVSIFYHMYLKLHHESGTTISAPNITQNICLRKSTLKDVIYGTLLGLKDSCLGIIDVLYNAAKAHFFKGVQHDSQEKNLSASASQKKSKSRKDLSKKKLSSKNNDAYGDVIRCSLFNAILFCLAFFVLFLITKTASLIIFWNPDESSWIYSVINVAVQLVTVIPIYIISKAANIFCSRKFIK
ncbi:hypothetical protein Avbf_03886 [Armadillidium vulgare]|nr:hypothetical protein Avbf_03886 [Armadillidium vulgare]